MKIDAQELSKIERLIDAYKDGTQLPGDVIVSVRRALAKIHDRYVKNPSDINEVDFLYEEWQSVRHMTDYMQSGQSHEHNDFDIDIISRRLKRLRVELEWRNSLLGLSAKSRNRIKR